MRRARLILALAVGSFGIITSTAAAHIQVSPTAVAPDDAVKFTVLVPGERAPHRIEEVVLRVPSEVLAYSFGSTPGWRRTTQTAKTGAVATITWKGEAEPDGFVEFSFLAATPTNPGTIAWKALQIYDDGKVVRWIGGPNSENPAPVTEVEADAPRLNAGGEGASGEDLASQGIEASADSAATSTAQANDDRSDRLSLWLAIAALGLAGFAFVLAVRKRG